MSLQSLPSLSTGTGGKKAGRYARLLVLVLCLLAGGFLTSLAPSSAHAKAVAAPTQATQAGQAVQLSSLTMINQRSGWALDANMPPHVYVTQQGPEHWKDVTPSQLTGNSGIFVTASYFPDATRGYIGATLNGTVLLLSTLDAGKSWQTTSLAVQSGFMLNQIFFRDTQHGWLNFGTQIRLDGQSALLLMGTSNGGKSWETLLDSGKNASGLQPAYFQSTRFTFSDLLNGWATGINPAGPVYLYATHDGGKSWSQINVMPIKGGSDIGFAQSYRPYWLNNRLGTLYVQYSTHNGQGYPGLTAYQTYDGGHSWILGPATLGTSFQDLYSPSFLNALQGWSFGFDGQGQYAIHHTSNGGRPWELIHPTGLLTPDSQNQVIGPLDFINPLTGWVFIKDIQNNWNLFQSDNGGHTWHALHPVVG